MAGHIASSGNVSWNTRPDHLELVRKVFGGQIEIDPCWNPDSTTDPKYICYLGNQEDGLELPWSCAQNAFVNPPFGACWYNVRTGMVFTPEEFNGNVEKGMPGYLGADRDEFKKSSIAHWLKKCALEAAQGLEVITIVPAAVDTAHSGEPEEGTLGALLRLLQLLLRLLAPVTGKGEVLVRV